MSIKSSKESTIQAYDSIKQSQSGTYKPLKTRYEHFNKICHGGLIKKKIYTIGALSSFGKSYTLRQMEADIFDENLNPGAKENVLLVKCDFEQSKEEYVLTKVHEKTNKEFEQLMFEVPDKETGDAFNEVYKELTSEYIYETFDTYSPDNFYNEVKQFVDKHTDKKQIVLTIDNINLIDVGGGEESKAIAKLIIHLVKLKRTVENITIIILAQLNRDLKIRSINQKEQFPRTTDFYYSSKIEHASDIQLIIHNPYLLGITEYGAVNYEKYEYLSQYLNEKNTYAVFSTKGLSFWHYLKVRLKNSMKDFNDLYIEEIYKLDENDTETKKMDVIDPVFESEKFNTSPDDAFGDNPF